LGQDETGGERPINEATGGMKRKPKERRNGERLGAALAVNLGKKSGVTRDVSASGVFFEIDAHYPVGSRIHFELVLDTPWGKANCDCRGRIVRVERHDGTVSIAVQFTDAKSRSRKAPRRRKR
jgi:hypothetical protein